MKPSHNIVIVAAKRTPIGAMLGQFASLSAAELAAAAHRSALKQANIDPAILSEVISGCVLSAGIGQAPARQAAIQAGIPLSVGATTLNKMCGSGMKAVMIAHDMICANKQQIILAGGMESMTNAPYLLKKARSGYRFGHGELLDHMLLDGLEDAYHPGKAMGYFADETAKALNITREQQDTYAYDSMTLALSAQEKGYFDDEIAPLTLTLKTENILCDRDENPQTSKLEKIARLKPAFSPQGTVTAGNASSIADGAASLLLMEEQEARAHGLTPIARIVAHASHAQEPAWFTTAPIKAIEKVLHNAGWTTHDVDLYEINEAFAVVALAAIQALDLKRDRVNIHGGACALGHPIGASGARILVTLLYALRQRNMRRGVAALCIGGGEATAMAIEYLGR